MFPLNDKILRKNVPNLHLRPYMIQQNFTLKHLETFRSYLIPPQEIITKYSSGPRKKFVQKQKKMKGYSKTRYLSTIDSSHLLSSSQNPNVNATPNQSFESGIKTHDFSSELEDEDSIGKKFGALKFNGKGSISSSFQLCSRAFSLRRSSSVSERYCRIHDQYAALASPLDDDLESVRNSKKEKNSGGKILKACKHIFGL